MVKHQPLQYYEPQLCLSCLTGIYGCRWKRYQRSHDDTTAWERLWFLLLLLTFFLTLTWFYLWWGIHNDYNEFNWFLYNRVGSWSDWSIPILATTAVGFTYVTALLILALCHVAVGQQMNLYWLHKVGLVGILAGAVVALASVAQLWHDEWAVLAISLQATAPFLHIGAVVTVTLLSWLVAGQFARTEKVSSQVVIFTGYFAVVLALYLVPLTISSPCIMDKKDLAPKPAIFGHRGAPMLAPENTLMAFRQAAEQQLSGFQTDVVISHDGVPFLLHDATLRRTTDVAERNPELAHLPASMLNWTDLEQLNAGRWFLETDPFWTASQLSGPERREAGNQSLCKLADLLQLLGPRANLTLLLSLQRLPRDHPYRASAANRTLDAILGSPVPQSAVMWLPQSHRQLVKEVAPGIQLAAGTKEDAARLRREGIQRVNLRYTQVSSQDISLCPVPREYRAQNVSVGLFTVNEPWLFSLLWCAGVQSVTSDNTLALSNVPSPGWILPPDEYFLIWLTCDLISFAVIVGVFVLQKWRWGSARAYNPEQIMLSAAVRRSSRDVKIMKEKLIFSEINDSVESADELGLACGRDGYSNRAVTPVQLRRGAGTPRDQ
ncbi:glycerophosphodiester phosphodiesterase domain-containing protein 5 isoform X2 [Ornithorhynchus anatinus]|uniref:glycerophosphodiester phosphodiesterase domain-containing protein 5 isoform X2 n=1 Tax=Ornithorhynchus anatinus TaxID=9258 RepID=UPI0010A880FD|nr:glycerophosphodiester phosphodiesterase domain-containing protein 5 isoform X2 [Ornithorhynchus anatinus]